MRSVGRAVLLIGSAKHGRSTSESLGSYLIDRLLEYGFVARALFVHRCVKGAEGVREMLAAVAAADVLVIATPLYVDSLPHPVTKALELIAEDRAARRPSGEQRLLCLVNCGFPEARHTVPAISICRRFAGEAGFIWAGGLALGAGETIGGRSLTGVKRMARNVIRALDLTAAAVAAGRTAPEKAVELMARPLVPRQLYMLVAHRRWRRQAKRNGVADRLNDRPYLTAP